MEQKNIFTTGNGQQILNQEGIDSYLEITTHFFKQFFIWWYIKMPIWHLMMLGRISTLVDDNFSISLLIKNILLPWRRDYSLIGYVVGISIKVVYLPIAIVAYLCINSIYISLILLWLCLPPATLFFIFRSILNV